MWLTEALIDGAIAVALTVRGTASSLVESWLYVPLGIMVMLLACFGVDVLLKYASVSFPASVACLILLFFGLLLMEWLAGHHRTRYVVALLDVPAGWSLRWINVFFMPTFVMLPLSPSIGGVEVAKIIAVFVVGFIVMMVVVAYMTRGLQLLTGSSKRAESERAEELGNTSEEIPLTEPASTTGPYTDTTPGASGVSTPLSTSAAASAMDLDLIQPPPRSQDPSRVRPQDAFLAFGDAAPRTELPGRSPPLGQFPLPQARSRRWALYLMANLDITTYATLLLLVGIPVYYATGYAMPLHLTITVLAYFAAMALPSRWRQYLHPVLVSAVITVLVVWVFGLTVGRSLDDTLTEYRTGLKYLQLWEGARTHHQRPGAGDVFGTVLDASIVSLALPMYQYRRELREHFLAIVLPNTALSVASVFGYPWVCRAVGISARRSLAFAVRSLTLALATPAVENLGGDNNTAAAVAIMSGIVGALVGQKMMAVLGIREDDYVTRGVTLGANSSAIATALLLRTDPRAAALSSLSMSLFGTITVLLTAIPPVRDAVRSLVGL
ncbi:hypothetical protein VTK73DRAFT_10368 [Phialemonium thermophilum]|uniref:Uncharacterized protein n=1 Tax=Phialemonium thermophilum TaxID=223376 RepID=A0ABR3VX44_9PEZI